MVSTANCFTGLLRFEDGAGCSGCSGRFGWSVAPTVSAHGFILVQRKILDQRGAAGTGPVLGGLRAQPRAATERLGGFRGACELGLAEERRGGERERGGGASSSRKTKDPEHGERERGARTT
jgi:hypothetical protein